MCLDNDTEREVFKEEGEPGSLPHLNFEKLQEENESESPGASNETASAACEKEPSNKVTKEASKLSRDASFAALNLVSVDETANVEDNLEKLQDGKECESPSSNEAAPLSCEVIKEASNEVMQTVPQTQQPRNMGIYLGKGGALDMNDSDHGDVLNLGHENIQVPQAEADATCTDEKVDCKIIEDANKLKEEYSSKVEVSIDTSCDSPEVCSRFVSVLNVSSSLG